jgi:hypothetical protein
MKIEIKINEIITNTINANIVTKEVIMIEIKIKINRNK